MVLPFGLDPFLPETLMRLYNLLLCLGVVHETVEFKSRYDIPMRRPLQTSPQHKRESIRGWIREIALTSIKDRVDTEIVRYEV